MDSPRGSVRRLILRARHSGRSRCRQADHRAGSLGQPALLPRFVSARTRMGSPRLPDDPSRAFALLTDPGRTGRPGHTGLPDTAPALPTAKASAISAISGLDHTASAPAVYASRAPSPTPMQDSLPAGGLRLYRRGVEPPGSLQNVSDHLIPLFRPSSWRSGNFLAARGPLLAADWQLAGNLPAVGRQVLGPR
jgi:hypothetical protein